MEDHQITLLFWQRQEAAIDATRDKYGAYCRSIALAVLGDHEDALECENDTYLAAWNSIPPNKPKSLSAYLGKLTRRIALNRLRDANAAKRGGGQAEISMQELGDVIPSNDDVMQCIAQRELSMQISAFLRKQPDVPRRVFIRRYWYCDSIRDIAKNFGFRESKVKMILLRTRNQLREFLEKEGLLDG